MGAGALGQGDEAGVAVAQRGPDALLGADDHGGLGYRGRDGGRRGRDQGEVLALVAVHVDGVAGEEARGVQQRVALGPPQADLELRRGAAGHVGGGDLAHPTGGGAGQVLVARIVEVRQLGRHLLAQAHPRRYSQTMDPTFEQMTTAERILYVQELWDRIAEEPEAVPVSDEMNIELRGRLAEHEADPSSAIPWEQVKADLRRRH